MLPQKPRSNGQQQGPRNQQRSQRKIARIAYDPGDRPFQYSWGGYLGLRVPEDPVFIDGRSDIYGDAPIREFAEAVQLRIDPQALFDKYDIDYVLYGVDQDLADWLEASPGWEEAYADDLAGIWVRRGDR